jgi:outer membrane protein assembly factor BamB
MRVFGLSLISSLVWSSLSAQEEPLLFHQAPKPLASSAVTSDWPRLLGPSDNMHSPETQLLKEWPAEGPPLVWEIAKGEGYTTPMIVGDKCVLFHAIDDKETIECVHAETGKQLWSYSYPITYKDRYGFANGPRGSATIGQGVVVTLGVSSWLHGLDLATGKVLWKHDLAAEHHVPQDFFGHGSDALIVEGMAIVNVGGKEKAAGPELSKKERAAVLASKGLCVGAFDLKTGELRWRLDDEWGASYASPVLAEMHGKKKVLVYAGGESDPPIGGLMCIDPATGKLDDKFSWRPDDYISATGSSPTVIPGKNRVFITTSYPKNRVIGGVMLELSSSFHFSEVWRSNRIGCHWFTPVHHEGYLYAVDGEREDQARMVCVDAATGEEKWSYELIWKDEALAKQLGRSNEMKLGFLRGSLIRVDGGFLGLGEMGTLLWLDLSPSGCKVLQRAQPFVATQTWSSPALSRGLLYVSQHAEAVTGDSGPRFLCYDLRAK